jgi:phosphatidylglycerophosphate synthase
VIADDPSIRERARHTGPAESRALAFKAYEIEELADIYFFRRLGILVARVARAVSLTPNAVSVFAAIVGGVGGALLAFDSLTLLGVVLIYAYGVLDSADGQLARLTGRTSEWGRVLDGIAGYVTHVAAYVAIAVRMAAEGSAWAWLLAAIAGICTIIHAQLYDYHRTTYAEIVVKGRSTRPMSRMRTGLLGAYERMQRALAGLHPDVERLISVRAGGGPVADVQRDRYRACFRRLMPGWNLFGDNVRRYAIAGLAIAGRLEWYFPIVLLLNAPLVLVWRAQWRTDARFLASGSNAQTEGPIDGRTVRKEGGHHDREA